MGTTKTTMGTVGKIFILHGWTYTHKPWNFLVQALREAGFKAELLPIPGLTAETDHTWTMDDYVAWLDKHVAKEKKVILIGHSNGGRIALALAARYPEKIQQLILIDSAGLAEKRLSIKIKRSLFSTAAHIGKKITKSENMRRLLYTLARAQDYRQASPHMRETMKNLLAVDLTPELHNITAPTLILWGANDTVTPVADAHILHDSITGSTLSIIPGAKHSPHITHPEIIKQKILTTLKYL